jgi:hypothetical protein
MKFTSAIGNFFFDENVPISLAKLVRDTVVVTVRTPKTGDPRITDADSARAFIRNSNSQQLAKIDFDLVLI